MKLAAEFETATTDEVLIYSPNQLRGSRNGRIRVVENFVSVVGDKLVTEPTAEDAIDYAEWSREGAVEDHLATNSAYAGRARTMFLRDV